jgi:signal-transduction protein with cAMP-binding, CBS, and nucleotidyltransferase domain
MKVADICTQEVVVADRASSLQRAAALMREHHVGTLLVTADAGDGDRAVGIVTDRDLVVEAMAHGLDVDETEVGRLATHRLAAVPAGASIGEAISAMKQAGVRRLIVTEDGGRIRGIVSLDDVLDALAHEMLELAHAARGGAERESAERPPVEPERLRSVHVPVY